MKRKICGVVAVLGFVLTACRDEVPNHKDLEQNMMDLKLYQENLGDQLRAKKLDDALWFLEGMDSILHVLNDKFDAHHRLNAPFSKGYEKELEGPIDDLREAVLGNDTAKAFTSYRLMVKGCNNCHLDNDVDKEVRF